MLKGSVRNVAVIGGGIGGLSAALAFAGSAKVTVYEQAPALTGVGAGIQITPNAARVLERLGLASELDAHSVIAQAVVPTDALTGRRIARFDLSNQKPPYRFFHRADLIKVLSDACSRAGVEFVLNARVKSVRRNGSFQANDQTVSPDLTVGADGLHSVVRPLLNAREDAFFTGQVAWRAIVPAQAAPEARIWMAPGCHVVTYPLTGDRLNVVAVQERDAWAAEGWHHEDDAANLVDAFADTCPELKAILTKVETPHLWGLFRHSVTERWGENKIAILGDAAHPTLPFLAQGANLAIEDAYVLARCCEANALLKDAIAAYQGQRNYRVIKAIDAANRNAVNYHLSGAKRVVAHAGLKMLGRFAPNAFLNRLSWLYDHDVTG